LDDNLFSKRCVIVFCKNNAKAGQKSKKKILMFVNLNDKYLCKEQQKKINYLSENLIQKRLKINYLNLKINNS